MVYEFIGKVKAVKKDEYLDMEVLKAEIEKIHAKFTKTLEIRVIRSEREPRRDILVKSKISIVTFSNSHQDDLARSITLFKQYLNEISDLTGGDVSRSEGFYNNDKTYSPLY